MRGHADAMSHALSTLLFRARRLMVSTSILLFVGCAASSGPPSSPCPLAGPNETYEVGRGGNPKPICWVGMQYPRLAAMMRASGWVDLRFSIDPKGRVKHLRVLDSSSPMFEAEAVYAVSRWRFARPVRDGQSVTDLGRFHRFTFYGR